MYLYTHTQIFLTSSFTSLGPLLDEENEALNNKMT